MLYKLLSENKLKVILSAKDMTELNIKYDDLEVSCPTTRSILLGLLYQISSEVNFDSDLGTLLVELYPTKSGGCIVVFSIVAKAKTEVFTMNFFEFQDSLTLIDCCISVFDRYSNLIFKSKLYKYQEVFFLGISTLDGESSPATVLMNEYATMLPCSTLNCACADEHMQIILEQDAIDTIYSAVKGDI